MGKIIDRVRRRAELAAMHACTFVAYDRERGRRITLVFDKPCAVASYTTDDGRVLAVRPFVERADAADDSISTWFDSERFRLTRC